MTAQGEQAAAGWRDADFAQSWAERDSFRDLLDFPRRLAAAIVADDNPLPGTILDVGAGPAGAVGFDDVWDRRLRAARKRFGDTPDGNKHHHNYPLTSFADHVGALDAAGITDVEVPWRSFCTCLFMGRKAG